MASFIIIEYSEQDKTIPRRFWRGGVDKGWKPGIYDASNFRIERNARDLLSQMKNFNCPCELRKDRNYVVLPFQEAKKLNTQKPTESANQI